MTLQKMIDECCERLDYYEANPAAPSASLHVYALSARIDAMLKLQFQEQKQNDYELY